MSAPSPPVDDLEPEGWHHDGAVEITEGHPRSKGRFDSFKHPWLLQAKDIWRMRVEVGGDDDLGWPYAVTHSGSQPVISWPA